MAGGGDVVRTLRLRDTDGTRHLADLRALCDLHGVRLVDERESS